MYNWVILTSRHCGLYIPSNGKDGRHQVMFERRAADARLLNASRTQTLVPQVCALPATRLLVFVSAHALCIICGSYLANLHIVAELPAANAGLKEKADFVKDDDKMKQFGGCPAQLYAS